MDCFSAEDQVHRNSGCAFTYSAILNKNWFSSTGCDQTHREDFGDTPPHVILSHQDILAVVQSKVMNNCKKSLKVQNPLFLILLQEPI